MYTARGETRERREGRRWEGRKATPCEELRGEEVCEEPDACIVHAYCTYNRRSIIDNRPLYADCLLADRLLTRVADCLRAVNLNGDMLIDLVDTRYTDMTDTTDMNSLTHSPTHSQIKSLVTPAQTTPTSQ